MAYHIAQTNSISLRRRPAKLASFAVVNFANKTSCYDFIKTTLKVAQSHGIEIPSITMDIGRDDRWLDRVTEHYDGRDSVGEVSRWECFGRSVFFLGLLYSITHNYCHSFDFKTKALDAASRAIQRAKDVHLFDTSNMYRGNKVFFHTYCYR